MQLGQNRVWNIFFRGDFESKIQKKEKLKHGYLSDKLQYKNGSI